MKKNLPDENLENKEEIKPLNEQSSQQNQKDKKQKTKFEDLTKGQKIITIINNCWSVIFICILIGFIIAKSFDGDPHNRMVSYICTSLCFLAPIVVQWLFRVRINPSIITIYLSFITISSFAGSCMRLFVLLPGLDKIQHFTWGYIVCFFALFILCKTKEIDSMKALTIILFFLCFSLATASVWEIVEFCGDTFLGQHAQGSPINGITPVTDTMFDIICHTGGTILFTIHYCLDKFTGKNLGIKSVVNDFKINY